MKRQVGMTLAILLLGVNVRAQQLESYYNLGLDSSEQAGVPHGKFVGPFDLPCKVYPGTPDTYWVYVLAQYDASRQNRNSEIHLTVRLHHYRRDVQHAAVSIADWNGLIKNSLISD
jgi:hypothetical protein